MYFYFQYIIQKKQYSNVNNKSRSIMINVKNSWCWIIFLINIFVKFLILIVLMIDTYWFIFVKRLITTKMLSYLIEFQFLFVDKFITKFIVKFDHLYCDTNKDWNFSKNLCLDVLLRLQIAQFSTYSLTNSNMFVTTIVEL